ncbi:peptidoglycan-binding domain-containing protein [Micromonospora aurantiaca (nom. illeg.)]|uniref:peptidoglycan-binding domain-containing protein n=1 Tax=Micromonospora aurantiaca (nom. illeg.) TaxID=47850 RepID=UPI0011A8B75B|nr:peptidoglycan-binding protein [Micromonospora aurantiaca]MBC9000455.1 peptidoglycan-binding protein [Micromonospora aurantiaca]
MGALTGGTVYDTYYKTTRSWRPIGPVVDEWQFYTASADDGYVCLGVVGNAAHWNKKNTGDHTSRSSHSTVIGGKTVYPKSGWVYAIDGRVPEPQKFETWFLGRLKAGAYPHVKYWNINNRHYNQKTGWKPSYSGDVHLHLSFDPGSEYADSTILADYERYRTGKPPAPAKPKPPAPKPSTSGRPTLRKGSKGAAVGRLQGALVAHGYQLKVDGDFGARTYAAVRSFQARKRITVDGIVGDQTWAKALAGQATVRQGDSGFAVALAQALLVAAGWNVAVDRDFGSKTTAAVRAFQKAKSLTVDGVVGSKTWARLVNG